VNHEFTSVVRRSQLRPLSSCASKGRGASAALKFLRVDYGRFHLGPAELRHDLELERAALSQPLGDTFPNHVL
jgi:hypothetical protein